MAWYHEQPWALVQTNLREPDFLDLDVDRYVDDVSALGATVVLVNSGGISASYATKLPFHTTNPYLQNPNILELLIEKLHQRNIRVLARTDFSKVPAMTAEQYPHWAYRTRGGDLMRYNGYVQTCINGDYQQIYALKILKELFERFDFDGLYCNMGGFPSRDYSHREYGFCHCLACQTAFAEYAHATIPASKDLSDPLYHRYRNFQKSVVDAYRQKILTLLESFSGRELCFDGVSYNRAESASELGQRPIDFLYHSSSNARLIRSNTIVSNADVDFLGFSHRHVSVPSSLHALRLYQSLANGGALDFYLMGRIDNHLDRTGFAPVGEIFSFYKAHHAYLAKTTNLAKVLLYRTDGWTISDEEKGWITLLTKLHIPFAESTAQQLKDKDLARYSLIILADAYTLQSEQALLLDQYVEKGGCLIATARSGLYDEYEGQRSTFMLASLAIKQVVGIRDDYDSSLFFVRDTDKQKVCPHLIEADVLPIGSRSIEVEQTEKADGYLPLIAPHPYGPPELCFIPAVSHKESGVIINHYKKGKTCYLPWWPAQTFYLTAQQSLKTFLSDLLLQWGGLDPLGINCPEAVEVSLRRTEEGTILLHLINTSCSHALDFIQPIPIYAITFRLECESQIKRVTSMMGKEVTFGQKEGCVVVQLSKLESYDLIVIEVE